MQSILSARSTWLVPALAATLAAPAVGLADEGAPDADVTPLSPEAMGTAEDPGVLSRRELSDLEPKRSRLPNNPYTHTDFTAYTLEWGETRVGLASVRAGVLPRTQVGTIPAALSIGALNGNAKVDMLRVGPVDVAATGAHYRFSRDGFTAQNTQLGGVTSVQVKPMWSMHVGGRWQATRAEGVPSFENNPWILDLVDPSLNQQAQQAEQAGVATQEDVYARAQSEYSDSFLESRAFTLKVASDIRFNRRDSLIIQAQANLWSSFDSTMDLGDIPAEDQYAKMAIEGLQAEGIRDTYITSVAWHFSWHRADLRLGAGLSSVPGAWVTQTADFAWRFGGPTRRGETRMTRTWKSNKRDLRRASAQDAPAPDAT